MTREDLTEERIEIERENAPNMEAHQDRDHRCLSDPHHRHVQGPDVASIEIRPKSNMQQTARHEAAAGG